MYNVNICKEVDCKIIVIDYCKYRMYIKLEQTFTGEVKTILYGKQES